MKYAVLSLTQKKQICQEEARLCAEGQKPTFHELAQWALKEFSLTKIPGRSSIARIIQAAPELLKLPDQPETNNKADEALLASRSNYVRLTAQQKNMIREEKTRLDEEGGKPTLLYLRQWTQQKFSLAKPPGKATILRILSTPTTAPMLPSDQLSGEGADDEDSICGHKDVCCDQNQKLIAHRMGMKYVSLTSAERKRIRDEAIRLGASEGYRPSNREMAEWAKDQFHLDKLPSKQTIARILREAQLPGLRSTGIQKRRRQSHLKDVLHLREHSVRAILPADQGQQSPEQPNTANPILPIPNPVPDLSQATTLPSTEKDMTSPLSTHALDTSTGRPAAGLALELYRREQSANGPELLLQSSRCDANGRVADLIAKDAWKEGVYRIRFMTEQYFALTNTDCFYPYCDITFVVRETTSHYHVPLLISPYGFTTYRGS